MLLLSYHITERVGKLTYRLNLPLALKLLYLVFYVIKLEPYKAREGY